MFPSPEMGYKKTVCALWIWRMRFRGWWDFCGVAEGQNWEFDIPFLLHEVGGKSGRLAG